MEPYDPGTRCEPGYAGTVLIDQLTEIVDSNFYIAGELCEDMEFSEAHRLFNIYFELEMWKNLVVKGRTLMQR